MEERNDKCYDLYWRGSLLTKMKAFRCIFVEGAFVFNESLAGQLDKLIQDVIVSAPTKVRLQVGAQVGVLCCDGVYAPGTVVQCIIRQGKLCSYSVKDERFSNRSVLGWVCKVEGCVEEVTCHKCQLRPIVSGVVDLVSIGSADFNQAQNEMLALCRLARRGCSVTTVDGVVHEIVVNDCQLLLFVDSNCCVFNYFKVSKVEENGLRSDGGVSLVEFARNMVWVMATSESFRSWKYFHATRPVQSSLEDNQSRKRRADIEQKNELLHGKCAKILEDALKKCDDVLDCHDEAVEMGEEQEAVLMENVSQGELLGNTLSKIAELLRNTKVERNQLVEEAAAAKRILWSLLKDVQSQAATAKIRQEQLLAYRRDFHNEVAITASTLRDDFTQIGRNIEEHLGSGSNNDTIHQSLEAVCALKHIVDSRNCSNLSSDDVVAAVRGVLEQFELWEEMPVDVSSAKEQPPFETPIINVSAVVGRVVTVETQTSASASTGVEPNEWTNHENVQKPHAKDRQSEVVEDEGKANVDSKQVDDSKVSFSQQSADDGASTARTSLSKNFHVSLQNSPIVAGGGRISQISDERGGISKIPDEVVDPSFSSICVRNWGPGLPVEYKFLTPEFEFSDEAVSTAASLTGGKLSNSAKQHEWLQHIRVYCNFLLSSRFSLIRQGKVLLLPAPDISPSVSVSDLSRKQPPPLRCALDLYVDRFNPPDSNEVLLAMCSYVKLQFSLFRKGCDMLRNVVTDSCLLSHLG